MHSRSVRSVAAAALVLLMPAVQAHHSQAMFDTAHPRTLTGTVREFQWTNPHCYIQLLVTNDAGQEEEWSIEMGAPAHLQGRGWGKYTLRAGDRISVTIAPLRSGGKGGELTAVARADGRVLGKVR